MSAPCPQYGFRARLFVDARLNGEARRALRARLYTDALDALGLVCDDEADDDVEAWRTIRRDGSQATDADREAMRACAASQMGVMAVDVGPLVDLSPAG